MEKLGSHWTNFREILCLSIILKSVDNIQVSLKHDNNTVTLHEDLCTFITSYRILLRMRNVSDKINRENKNILYSITGESNGKLPPRTCPGCSVPEPYRSHDWALVPANPAPKAEY